MIDVEQLKSLGRVVLYKWRIFWDGLFGLDFFKETAYIEDDYTGDDYPYDLTILRDFRTILKELPLAREKTVFMDIGCGKGLIFSNMKQLGFKKAYGIEKNEHIFRVCQSNCQQLGLTNIILLNMDAKNLSTEMDECNLFFFYNPFSNIILETVLENLKQSLERKKREVFIIYRNPMHADCFNKAGFKPIKVVKDSELVSHIYSMTSP